MSRPQPDYLRLFAEPTRASQEASAELERLEALCEQFEQATGWPLQFLPHTVAADDHDMLWSAPVESGREVVGQLAIQWGGHAVPHAALHDAIGLAEMLLDTFNRWLGTQKALVEREAELAAGVPLVSVSNQVPGLAQRLQSMLKTAAESVDCQSAGLYLLDAGTSELKLRSSWNLPSDRLLAAPRSLEECPADLEAMAGHAIAIENPVGGLSWRLPEQFASGLCLPVSGPETILGTMWLFGVSPRAFSDAEVRLAEMATGSLSAELDRAMLRREISQASEAMKAQAQEQQYFLDSLPSVVPQLNRWDLAGRTDSVHGRTFYDWFPSAGGSITTVVAQIETARGTEMLTASTLRGLLRAHGSHVHQPHKLLALVNSSLYSSSAGDQRAAVAVATVHPDHGKMEVATAGHVGALALHGERRWKALSKLQTPLGALPEVAYESLDVSIGAGEEVVFFTQAPRGNAPAIPPAACYSAVASACTAFRERQLDETLAKAQARLWPQNARTAAGESCMLLMRNRDAGMI